MLQIPVLPVLAENNTMIKKIGSTNCYQPGETLEVMGRGFGKPSSKRKLVLQNNSQRQVIKSIRTWADKKIIARLPKVLAKPLSQKYVLGIVDGQRWISNRDVQITVCDSPKIRIPQLFKSPNPQQPPARFPKIQTETSKTDSQPALDKNPAPETTTVSPFARSRPPGQQVATSAPTLPPSSQIAVNSSKQDSASSEPQEVIVVTTTREQTQALEQFVRQYSITVKRRNSYPGLGMILSVLRIPAEYASADVVQQLTESFPEFSIDLNHRYQLLASQSSPVSDSKHWAYDTLQWASVIRDCPVRNKLGIIDTGVATIAAIDQNRIHSQSMLSNGVKAATKDHGTAVASLLLGSTDRQIPGLLPTSTLYSAGIFRLRDDNYTDTTAELILKALNWMVEQQVAVINMSLGGPQNRVLEIAIQRLLEKGIILVSAAGTDAQGEALYPAAQPGVIAVTAIDANFKPLSKVTAGDYVDFTAPGVDLWLFNAKGKGRYLSGSSFASPIIAATYALLNLNPQTYDSLKNNVRDLGKTGRDQLFGWGLPLIHPLCHK